MSATTKEYKTLVVGIDVETTGAYYGKDLILMGAIVAIDPKTMTIIRLPQRTNLFGRRFPKADDIESYRKVWEENGFEMRCFEEFWTKNIDTLRNFQDENSDILSDDDVSLASRVNDILRMYESFAEKLIIVSGAIAFGPSILNVLLVSYGHKPLYYSRDGKYRWLFHTPSYFLGLLGMNIIEMTGDDWKEYDEWLEQCVHSIELCPVKYDHHPENDAIVIAWNFINACNYKEATKYDNYNSE